MYKQGDIYWVEFTDNSTGHEFKGRRPAIVIQSSDQIRKSNTITIIPLTGNIENHLPEDILVSKNNNNNLFINSIAKVYYIMSFDKTRFIKKIGVIDEKVLKEIISYLKKHFDI